MPVEIKISDQEAELYDRQIRLWGVDAQNRLRNANVLIIGFDGIGVEAAKNIMLTGVRSVTIVDDRKIGTSPKLLHANFFIDSEDQDEFIVVGSQGRCAKLNPNVELKTITENPADIKEDLIKKANFVILCGQTNKIVEKVSKICRSHNILYIAAEAYGFYGATFTDFGDRHAYKCEQKIDEGAVTDDVEIVPTQGTVDLVDGAVPSAPNDADAEPVEKRRRTAEHHEIEAKQQHKIENFLPFDVAFHTLVTEKGKENAKNVKERRRKIPKALYIVRAMRQYVETHNSDNIDLSAFETAWNTVLTQNGLSDLGIVPADFAWSLEGQLTPTCAVLGGIVAQELVKGISLKDRPYNNTFVFDGSANNGTVVRLPSDSV